MDYFKKAQNYINSLNLSSADHLDKKVAELLANVQAYERASQALRRRFVRGAVDVEAMDRNKRITKIKREPKGKDYEYYVQGADGSWNKPNERIWIVSMYALWQESKKKK